MDISDFLIEKGYQIESKIITRKGRGKIQFSCNVNKKPEEQDLLDCEDKYGIEILKCNFKKGKELTILIKQSEDKKPFIEPEKELTLDETVEIIYNQDLSREELKQLLTTFRNTSYAKGFQAHKTAIKKLIDSL